MGSGRIGVLIVDDEYLLRDLIKSSVDFEALGFEIAGEAEDGRQALQKIEELEPQLAIVDINIPFINGIELSKIVRELKPWIKIIILTGYSDFQYAKECVKTGVRDYLLKPLDVDELSRILINIRGEIQEEQSQKDYLQKLEKQVKSSVNLLKEQFLNQLVSGVRLTESDIAQQLESYGIGLSPANLVVAAIEIDNMQSKWEKDEDRRLWRFAVANIAAEIFSGFKPAAVFNGPGDHVLCITNGSRSRKNELDIVAVCEKIIDSTAGFLGFTVTMGIGGPCGQFFGLPAAYEEALIALRQKFYHGGKRVYQSMDIKGSQPVKELFSYKSDEEILILLRTGNREPFLEMIKEIHGKVLGLRPSLETVQMIYSGLASAVVKYLWENSLKPGEVIPELDNYLQCIKEKETLDDLNAWITRLYDEAVRSVTGRSKSGTTRIVELARKYMEANYEKTDISLEEISERIFVNPSYLSKVFKREMKHSVIEYLTELRMKKAKALMDQNPGMQISYIANRVGYPDPFYFSKLFKKSFGISPSKYGERNSSF